MICILNADQLNTAYLGFKDFSDFDDRAKHCSHVVSQSVAPKELSIFQQELMASGRLVTIYLSELKDSDFVAIAIIRLITSSEEDAPKIVEELKQQNLDADIIDLVETVLVSKFKKLKLFYFQLSDNKSYATKSTGDW